MLDPRDSLLTLLPSDHVLLDYDLPIDSEFLPPLVLLNTVISVDIYILFLVLLT